MLNPETVFVTHRTGVRVPRFTFPLPLTRRHALVLMVAFLGSALPVSAYTYRQVGVATNFVVHDGRVYFGQSDGSLTILNLESGEVIARRKGNWEPRSLRWTDAGILLQSFRGTAMLNPSTLDAMWQIRDQSLRGLAGRRLVTCDGNGLVECRELETGKVLWSCNLGGALDVSVESEKVFVFRSATFDGPERVPAVVLLELETGKETLHKTTPDGIHYLKAYFDGQRIYLASGTFKGVFDPRYTIFDKGRPSARFQKLLVWDLNGNEIEAIPAPEGLKDDQLLHDTPFALGSRVFARGRVYANMDAVPSPVAGLGRLIPEELPMEDPEKVVTRFEVEGGTLTMRPAAICRSMFIIGGNNPLTISLESEHGKWTGTLPYLPAPGVVSAVGSTSNRLLLGSNLGHVECVDLASGKSLWMYIFPTIRQTTSYSSRALPPDKATAAANYERDNRDRGLESGLKLAGSTEPSQPKIILDPSPTNPFKK